MTDQPLWTPSPERIAASNMAAFMKFVNDRHGTRARRLRRAAPLLGRAHRGLLGRRVGLLRRDRGHARQDGHRRQGEDAGGALLPRGEAQFRREPAAPLERRRDDADADARSSSGARTACARRLSHAELRDEVSRMQQALAAAGVKAGDRVAAFMPNMPETVVAMLAAASLGAIFTSCSPDFGVQGVLDRFGQVEPKVLVLLRRLLLQRQGDRDARAHRRDRGAAAHRASASWSCPTPRRSRTSPPCRARCALADFLAPFAPKAPRVRAPAVQPSALHPLLQRHDRRAQVHRARRGRRAAHAPEGARAALRREARRPPLLLHDLRLDDVELARLGARRGRDAPALRRLALPRARQHPLRLRRTPRA